ncbi:recombinase family protein [Aeromonas hydrophila]|uniref:recombinase family protein n=1 Tax=Aeromonas hydrophila TaxID=644 RepID=UPI00140F6462|nr:recombinase family protein [Aeromonas hydrophila]NHT33361.1 recombinase family protein [Aeromonas hydrophila]
MNQRIGYARGSIDDQNLALQHDLLCQAGCVVIYEEATTEKTTTTTKLDLCRKELRKGDTLVVWRLDRLARNLHDLVAIVVDLERSGVYLESLYENIETASIEGRQQFHVFAALAQFELNVIRERTLTGLAVPRARGRAGGRRPKLDKKQVLEIKALLHDPNTQVAEVARRYGVSRTTLYKYVGVVTPRQ